MVISKFKVELLKYNNAETAIEDAINSFNRDRLTVINSGRLLKIKAPSSDNDVIKNSMEQNDENKLKANDIKWLTGAISIADGNQPSDYEEVKQKLASCQENLITFATNVIQSNGQQNLSESGAQIQSFVESSGSQQ